MGDCYLLENEGNCLGAFLGYFVPKLSSVIYCDKMGLATYVQCTYWAIFFENSSGHPD
jgi:hypothetical protein